MNRVGTINKIAREAEVLEQQLERAPMQHEIAHELEVDSNDINETLTLARRHRSLEEPLGDSDKNVLIDVIKDETMHDPDHELMFESLRIDVRSTLATLKPREREVIEMYFGINREYALTLNEIGEHFKITRERVRQIKERAIRRLSHKSRREPLKVHL